MPNAQTNGSISFILKFQDAELLQQVRIIDFLNIPVVISKATVVGKKTYNNDTPIGLISNYTVFRDGMAFNVNVWMKFVEGIDLTKYRAECEFKTSANTQKVEIVSIYLRPDMTSSDVMESNESIEPVEIIEDSGRAIDMGEVNEAENGFETIAIAEAIEPELEVKAKSKTKKTTKKK